MSRLGADAAQLEQLSGQLAVNATVIDEIVARATSLLEQAWWEGEDARIFREQWATGASQLVRLTAALRDASSLTARSAQQQREASQ